MSGIDTLDVLFTVCLNLLSIYSLLHGISSPLGGLLIDTVVVDLLFQLLIHPRIAHGLQLNIGLQRVPIHLISLLLEVVILLQSF